MDVLYLEERSRGPSDLRPGRGVSQHAGPKRASPTRSPVVCHLGRHPSPLELDSRHLSGTVWHGVVLSTRASSAPPHQEPQPGPASVVCRRGLDLAQCVGLVARRSHGRAAAWNAATASGIAAVCSLAVVAADGSRETLWTLTESAPLSRDIQL